MSKKPVDHDKNVRDAAEAQGRAAGLGLSHMAEVNARLLEKAIAAAEKANKDR